MTTARPGHRDLDARVPSTPKWSVRDLAHHIGEEQWYWGQNVAAKDASVSRLWEGVESPVCVEVVEQANQNLDSYRVNPPLLEEQVNIELAAAEGGYGRRQIYELVQNGADAQRW